AERVCNNVDLPMPFAPIKQVNSPLKISAVIPSATIFVFPLDEYPMERLLILIVFTLCANGGNFACKRYILL
ncbi:hypothetical protein EZS27_038136, partial [termite gut metagenome]